MWIFLLLLNVWTTHEQKLRLQGGDGPCRGRVEVFYNGTWGFVCNHKWQAQNGQVVCRSLGCGHYNSTEPVSHYRYPDAPSKAWMDEVTCTGTESHLWDCPFPGWGINNCAGTYHHVNIECTEEVVLSLQYGCAGALQYKTSNGKRTVCDTNLSAEEANVVCRELGCGESLRIPAPGAFLAEGPALNTSLNCIGDEKYLWQCATGFGAVEACPNPVSVICSNQSSIRLSEGKNRCSGELQVKVNGNWESACKTSFKIQSAQDLCTRLRCGKTGWLEPATCNGSEPIYLTCSDTVEISLLDNRRQRSHCFGAVYVTINGTQHAVCSEYWDTKDGEVVCRELGCGKLLSFSEGRAATNGWLNQVDCDGSESSLWYCLAQYGKVKNCKEASVICEKSVAVHLVDGLGKCSGRVEIRYKGMWWSVSKDGLSKSFADRVCSVSDCGTSHSFTDLNFIHGPAKVLKPSCPNGDIKSVDQCFKDPPNEQNVGQKMKVICTGHKALFLEGSSPCSGAVGIETGGTMYWLAGSRETWQQDTATVVCRQMQCGSALSFSAVSRKKHDRWHTAYNCTSNETSLFDCSQSPVNVSEVAFVNCSGTVAVSLEGSRCWGKVRVCADGSCGGVCEDGWTQEQSDMLCKSLGCGNSLSLATVTRSAGISWSSVHCVGSVPHLSQCNFVPHNANQYCQDRPAYVMCSDSLMTRLVDPRDRCAGNVEVFHSGLWLPVCKEALETPNVRSIICRDARCDTRSSGWERDSLYKPSETSGLKTLTCENGDNITKCSIPGDVIKCNPGALRCANSARMLLKKDNSPCEGPVFVLQEGILFAVSSEGWGDAEGQVLCSYLSCGKLKNHTAVSSLVSSWWTESYRCRGNEGSIWDCTPASGTPAKDQQLYISCTGDPVVNLNDGNKCYGQVRITMDGIATGVCGDHWTEEESSVLCQGLGCSKSISFKTGKSGLNEQLIHASCTGQEYQLGQCGTSKAICKKGPVSVACADSFQLNLTKKCGGQVQVHYWGDWESVCPLQSPNVAALICSELNCGGVKDHKEEFIPENQDMETSLVCTGGEKFIRHCVKKQPCKGQRPAVVYCEEYSEESIPTAPVGTIVAFVVLIILVMAAAVLLVWLRTRKAKHLKRTVSSSDSGDYEDVITNENEMTNMLMKNRGEQSEDVLELITHVAQKVPGISVSTEDELGGRPSSVLEYDDVEAEVTDAAQPAEITAGTPEQDQTLGDVGDVEGAGDVEGVITPQEDYDDVIDPLEPEEEVALVAEPHPSDGDGAEISLESRDGEDYMQPD
ncbi:hypothetical protein MATL_G00111660 [Megalops atlanticus]|uniref:SRCR domain-containing protein n=1 Tax=Megalops atlanticus TaxID=7932 RepID=A0A9D3PZW0_MEGAT|nr:hypothetical protein MATL_G00111660 [Megalops atlanticus]